MVRIGASPTPAAAAAAPVLPKVSFTKVEDDALVGLVGVSDSQARSYGYNDGSSFRLPEHYIRYIEPLESELAVQVEYDMDEQDQEWLDSINAERKAANLDKVSYETFEVVMDRLEKEWFDLTKNLPKPDLAMPSEDSTCAICDDSEGENTNAIVFCDGCNLAVHQDCYGVPYIPEGQWLCRKCTVSPENPVSCILCPNEGGAFKQTVHGEWVHLLCAIWVPETRVANDVFMEPVTGVDRIPKQRWKLKCSICDVRSGACIQCIKASCFSAFHATCARKEKLLMPMKASQGSEAPTLACYCEKHLPREQAEARIAALQSEQSSLNPTATTTTSSSSSDGILTDPPQPSNANTNNKTARAYAKTYKPGPPLVPKIVVDRILAYIGKINVRHKREFLVLVCKYWSLKREARRGAPLLKRLHLEPWTANAGGRGQGEDDRVVKLKMLKDLRGDLERLKTLSDTVRRREIQKLRQQNCVQHILQRILYPFHPVMRSVFENIKSGDKQDYFLSPVSKVDVPDYYDVITKPMSWSVIDRKLSEHVYMDLQDFKDDILLVLDNAMLYNKPDTPFYKAAQRIKKATERVFPELDQFVNMHHHTQASLPLVSTSSPPSRATDPAPDAPPQPHSEGEFDPEHNSHLLVGDLEPSLRMLDFLIDHEHITDKTTLVIDKQPIEALFAYEFAEVKLPQPFPIVTPAHADHSVHWGQGQGHAPEHDSSHEQGQGNGQGSGQGVANGTAPQGKKKRDRKAERERLKERRAEAAAIKMTAPPRTRRARAAAGLELDAGDEHGLDASVSVSAGGAGEGGSSSSSAHVPAQASEDGHGEVDPDAMDVDRDDELQPPAKRRRGSKRVPIMLPGQSEVPPVVDAVDDHTSFSMFDGGWILPEGQKRHNRSTMEPKKGPKSERDEQSVDGGSALRMDGEVERKHEVELSSSAEEPPPPPSLPLPFTVEHQEEAFAKPADEPFLSLQVVEVPMDVDIAPAPELVVDSVQETTIPIDITEDQHDTAVLEDSELEHEEVQVEQALAQIADDVLPASDDHSAVAVEETITAPSAEDISMEEAEIPPVVEEVGLVLQSEGADNGDTDQQSDLTALSDSEFSKSPLRLKNVARRRSQDHDPSLSSGELTELPTPDESEGQLEMLAADEEAAPADGEGTSEPGPSSKKSPRKKSGATSKGKAKVIKKQAAPSLDPEAGKVILKRGQALLEEGTLVWAKFTGFPWWPSVVYNFENEIVPKALTAHWSREELEDKQMHIVRFFDEHDSWQIIAIDNILMLGESDDLDEDMLARRSTRQRWKKGKQREGCEKAFLRAVAEMER